MRATVATKFVAWEVPKLKNLQVSKVYRLRIKLNNGGKLSREEKDWHTRAVNSNSYFKSTVPKHFQRHEIIRFPQKTRKNILTYTDGICKKNNIDFRIELKTFIFSSKEF